MADVPHIFDRTVLRDRRRRVAATANDHDFLLERVADDFVERLSVVKRQFALAADIGAHHGLLADKLCRFTGIGSVIEISDLADPDIARRRSGTRRLIGEPDRLPLKPASLDLAVSALSLQLVDDLPGALAQIRQALRPDGLFLGALLGGDTLRELREAWMLAEDEVVGGISPRVAPFADVRALGSLLQRAGFALPTADSERVTVRYASPLALMREVKAMGASNMLTERRRVPATRKLLFRAAEIYAERFADADGRVPATFEIVTLTAWAPDASQPKPLQPGSAKMRLADALGTRERPAGDKTGR